MSTEQSSARLPLRARDGSIRTYAIVDATDYEWASQYRWHLNRGGYVQRTEYIASSGKTRKRLLARELLGAPEDREVDHVDRDKLNNRRANLRLADRRINVLNTGQRVNTATGYRGVYFDGRRRTNTFRALISVDYERIHLGMFATAEEAARAYDEAARKHNGEHAMLNFPDERKD